MGKSVDLLWFYYCLLPLRFYKLDTSANWALNSITCLSFLVPKCSKLRMGIVIWYLVIQATPSPLSAIFHTNKGFVVMKWLFQRTYRLPHQNQDVIFLNAPTITSFCCYVSKSAISFWRASARLMHFFWFHFLIYRAGEEHSL